MILLSLHIIVTVDLNAPWHWEHWIFHQWCGLAATTMDIITCLLTIFNMYVLFKCSSLAQCLNICILWTYQICLSLHSYAFYLFGTECYWLVTCNVMLKCWMWCLGNRQLWLLLFWVQAINKAFNSGTRVKIIEISYVHSVHCVFTILHCAQQVP